MMAASRLKLCVSFGGLVFSLQWCQAEYVRTSVEGAVVSIVLNSLKDSPAKRGIRGIHFFNLSNDIGRDSGRSVNKVEEFLDIAVVLWVREQGSSESVRESLYTTYSSLTSPAMKGTRAKSPFSTIKWGWYGIKSPSITGQKGKLEYN